MRRGFHYLLETVFLRAWYVRREIWRLTTALGKTPRVLDAGMGFGQYSDLMKRILNQPEIVGLEIDRQHFYGNEQYFRAAEPPVKFTVGDVQRLPFAASEFDLILSVDVMEHIEDDVATFAEFSRVLRRGGVFVMHTPRIKPGSTTDEPAHNHHDDQKWTVDEHFRDGYRDHEAVERLERAGFTIKRLTHGYGPFGMVAWTLLQRIPMSLLNRGKLWLVPVACYLVAALPLAVLAMLLDLVPGDQVMGGSLLIVAEKK